MKHLKRFSKHLLAVIGVLIVVFTGIFVPQAVLTLCGVENELVLKAAGIAFVVLIFAAFMTFMSDDKET